MKQPHIQYKINGEAQDHPCATIRFTSAGEIDMIAFDYHQGNTHHECYFYNRGDGRFFNSYGNLEAVLIEK